MMNLLFSPNGRISSGEFMKAAIILIALSLGLGIPALMGMKTLSMILGLVGLVLYYCWVAIWIKRYHDAGKGGANCLIPIIIYIIGAMILFGVIAGGPYMEIIQASGSGASPDEIQEMSEKMQADVQLPMMIGGTILSAAIAFLFNSLIKGDPGENQFGPAT